MELVCGAFGRTPPLSARFGTDRLWVATQRDSWRLERDWKDRNKDRTSVHVSDGVTMWLPTYSGAFHVQRAHPDSFPARNLLDPAWLAGYDWETPLADIHNGRNVLVMTPTWQPQRPARRAASTPRQCHACDHQPRWT